MKIVSALAAMALLLVAGCATSTPYYYGNYGSTAYYGSYGSTAVPYTPLPVTTAYGSTALFDPYDHAYIDALAADVNGGYPVY